MDKTILVEQLGEKLRSQVVQTHRAASEAREDARSGAPRAVNLALAQGQRSVHAREALDALEALKPRAWGKAEPIGLGAVVEIEDGAMGRTVFIAPVGAGEELTGPGGDGLFQVVTPVSPLGRALLGKRRGDLVELTVAG